MGNEMVLSHNPKPSQNNIKKKKKKGIISFIIIIIILLNTTFIQIRSRLQDNLEQWVSQ